MLVQRPHFLRYRLDALTHIKTNSRGYWYLMTVGTRVGGAPLCVEFNNIEEAQ